MAKGRMDTEQETLISTVQREKKLWGFLFVCF